MLLNILTASLGKINETVCFAEVDKLGQSRRDESFKLVITAAWISHSSLRSVTQSPGQNEG